MSNNFLLKLWYKFSNKSKYQDFKNEKRVADKVKYYNSRIYNQILEIQKKIESLNISNSASIVFHYINNLRKKE